MSPAARVYRSATKSDGGGTYPRGGAKPEKVHFRGVEDGECKGNGHGDRKVGQTDRGRGVLFLAWRSWKGGADLRLEGENVDKGGWSGAIHWRHSRRATGF